MTSRRYIILSTIYIICYYVMMYHSPNDNQEFYNNPYVVMFGSTFIFMYVIKYLENSKCTKNKLPNKYLISQSIFYSLLALFSHNIYVFFLEKECIVFLNKAMNNISNFTYIFEALFVAGIVLLTNQLSYLIYPRCS